MNDDVRRYLNTIETSNALYAKMVQAIAQGKYHKTLEKMWLDSRSNEGSALIDLLHHVFDGSN